MATYANNRNTAVGLPTILDGSSKVIPYSRNQRWEVFISQANMNLSPQGRLIESYDKGLVVGGQHHLLICQMSNNGRLRLILMDKYYMII